jgi:hypothetical protein
MTTSLNIPSEQCYWGLLDPAPAASNQELTFRFESLLPFPVENLHCSHLNLPDDRILIVGVPHELMRTTMATADGQRAWSAHPGSLPQNLDWHDIPVNTHALLELMTGKYEPTGRKRYRTLVTACWLTCCTIACCIILIAAERRRSHLLDEAILLNDREISAINSAVPLTAENRTLPPHARLLQASRQIQGTGTDERPIDAIDLLHQLWRHLPNNAGLSLQEIQMDQRRLMLKADLQDLGTMQRISETSKTLETTSEAWLLEPPDLPASQGKTFPVVLVWTRALSKGKP